MDTYLEKCDGRERENHNFETNTQFCSEGRSETETSKLVQERTQA